MFAEKKRKTGFTLIELLLAVAIVAILAGAILVTTSQQRTKAQYSRALSEMSGLLQPILMCKSDGGTVNSPSGNTNICSLSANYGTWPSIGSGTALSDFTSYSSSGLDTGTWYYYVGTGSVYICCNSTYSRCAQTTGCDSSTDLR